MLSRDVEGCSLVGRREVGNPGDWSDATEATVEARPLRDHDPRLQPVRHNHPVCRAQGAGGQGHWRCAPASGVHPVSQYHRTSNPGWQDRPRGARKLRRPQASKVRAWLGRHPRFVRSLHLTSGSWLNALGDLFARLSQRRLKRGAFCAICRRPSTASSQKPTIFRDCRSTIDYRARPSRANEKHLADRAVRSQIHRKKPESERASRCHAAPRKLMPASRRCAQQSSMSLPGRKGRGFQQFGSNSLMNRG